MTKKKTGLIIALLFAAAMCLNMVAAAAGAPATTVYDSDKDTTAKLSWTAFNSLLGYGADTSAPTGAASTGVYEFRTGAAASGQLKWSWTFDGSKFTAPITSDKKGPIQLFLTQSYDKNAAVLTVNFTLFDAGTDGAPDALSGNASLKLYVGDNFKDGSLVHFIDKSDLNTSQTCTVTGGYVTFDVGKGGTYYLKTASDMGTFKVSSGKGTENDPYIVDSSFSISWKLYNQFLGYSVCNITVAGVTPTEGAFASVSKSAGNYKSPVYFTCKDTAGKALWTWIFDGGKVLSPITYADKSPVKLAATVSASGTTVKASLSMHRDLPGGATLMLYVGDRFKDGDAVTMTYVPGTSGGDYDGGYKYTDHATVLSGLVVSGGYITVAVPHGGDFTLTAAASFPFADVSTSDPFYDAVKFVYGKGYFTGTSTTTFEPGSSMNRAMFVTVLYRMAGSPAVTNAPSSFSDLTEDWYKSAVAWAVSSGITSGTSGTSATTFSPKDNVSRAQAAVFLFRYAQLTGYNTTFTTTLAAYSDHDAVPDWAKPAIRWCLEKNVLTGLTATTLAPGADATRAALAVSVMALSNLPK
jgi:hypothetical protein